MDAQDPAESGGSSDLTVQAAEPAAALSPPPAPWAPPPPAEIEPVYHLPPEYPSPYAYPPPVQPKRSRRTLWLVIGAIVLVVILVLAGGGFAANAFLSSTYSPERAVTDYFAAQSRGNVSGMMANATFQVGANPEFFDKSAITPMMEVPQNKQLSNVKVVSSQAVDSSTQSVAVSMMWAGKLHGQTYMVNRDNSQVHDFFYHSWRVVIPFATIHITLPKQPGPVQIDGISPSGADPTTVQVVEGYHEVTMITNFLYDNTSQVVDAVDSAPTAAFAPSISSRAVSLAAASVKRSFAACDPAQYAGCLDHTYSAPNDGYRYYFDLPGYGKVYFNTYRLALAGDPTAGMKLTVSTVAGKVDAAGTCAETMTIDGSTNYNFVGVWAAVLTWGSSAFSGDLTFSCEVAKA